MYDTEVLHLLRKRVEVHLLYSFYIILAFTTVKSQLTKNNALLLQLLELYLQKLSLFFVLLKVAVRHLLKNCVFIKNTYTIHILETKE